MGMNNLQYCTQETRVYVNAIMYDKGTHWLTIQTIRDRLTKDCLDAYRDVLLAAQALKKVLDDITMPESANNPVTEKEFIR